MINTLNHHPNPESESYDYKRFSVLYVDDEEKSLKYFARILSKHFRILTAANAETGFRIFDQNKDDIAVFITDQRMPGEKGVSLLEKVRKIRPRTIRMLVTAYADNEVTIEAINSGAIYRCLSKPWNFSELEAIIRQGMRFFLVQSERDQLLKEKLTALHNMVIKDRVISLGIVAAGLGHYVRNSLVAVRTFLDLAPEKLKEELNDSPNLRNPNYWNDFYGHVQTQVARISKLLTDLGMASQHSELDFSSAIRTGDLIIQAVEKTKTSMDAKGITVMLDIEDELPALHFEEERFRSLFDLLLQDEITNLPEGSRIELKAQAVPDAESGEKSIRIVISDNGPGLPREAVQSVFDPFFLRNTDQQEFGINLMACYFIVYHHGGEIHAASEEGEGTTFTITLPTKPRIGSTDFDEQAFINKVLTNETLWENLLAGS